MIRTTIRLNNALMSQVKKFILERNLTFTALVCQALITHMNSEKLKKPKKKKFTLPVFKGKGGLQPGVDINNSAALYDLLDKGLPINKLR